MTNKIQKISVVKHFQQLMQNKNNEEAYKLITKDAVWHSDEIGAPWSGMHRGINAIKEHFANISGTTQDFRRQTHEFIEHGNMVIEIGELSCILNKTGRPFQTDYICLYTVDDNQQISSYRIYEDSLKLYQAYFA